MKAAAPSHHAKPNAGHKHLRIALYAVSWVFLFLWLAAASQPDQLRAQWLGSTGWVFAITMWCREDALLKARPLPTLSLWVVLLAWPIAVPVCVVRLYGVMYGTLLLLMHIILYLFAAFVFAFALALVMR